MSWNHHDEVESHWFADFIFGLIGGTMSIYNFFGWVLPLWGLLTQGKTLALCGIIGLGFGTYLARENVRTIRQKSEDWCRLGDSNT